MDASIKIPTEDRVTFRDWLPVLGLAVSAFIFNTSEFIPVGLLSDISKDLNISEAKTGFLISAYAWVVALVSLPLMLLFSKVERKRLLSILFVIFILSHILSFFASDYNILLVSRLGIACAHSVYWAIIPPLAVSLSPKGQRSRALGIVAAGSSIAMVLGLPLGRIIGLAFGWRVTFLSIGFVALLILIILLIILPKVPSNNSETIRNLPQLLKKRSLLGLYLLTTVIVIGHFTAYSYIEPFMLTKAGFDADLTTVVLLIFGGSGFLGSILFSKFSDKNPYRLMFVSIIGVFLSMLLLSYAANHWSSLVLICVCWSICNILFNLSFQIELMKIAPKATSIAMAIYSGTFNFGIGSGAFVGGLVCTYLGIDYIGYVGAIISLFAICLCAILIKRFFGKYDRSEDI